MWIDDKEIAFVIELIHETIQILYNGKTSTLTFFSGKTYKFCLLIKKKNIEKNIFTPSESYLKHYIPGIFK